MTNFSLSLKFAKLVPSLLSKHVVIYSVLCIHTYVRTLTWYLLCFRFILIDWIIEVASMKKFSPLTVHLAVYLVDRYICFRKVNRSRLQLLGISCLLLSSRWTSDVILTIREASWLTEATYSYDEVVRMTGDVLAAFRGNIRVCTIFTGLL